MHHLVYALLFGALLVSCSRKVGSPVVQPQFYPITGEQSDTTAAVETAAVAATIAPYAAQLDAQMNRVLAQVATPLTKERPESSLGNWTADLLLAAARDLFPSYAIAFAAQNYGGLRTSEIGTGPLLVSEIYELMPFDNELVLVELDGTTLLAFIAHMLAGGGWPVSKGLSISGPADAPRIKVQGQPIDPAATYYVAMPDYVANGGDDAAMLAARPQYPSGRMIRDLLIEYASRSTAPIAVQPDGSRIKLDE